MRQQPGLDDGIGSAEACGNRAGAAVASRAKGSGHMAIETVKLGGFSMKCLVFGRGSDALVILPGLSVGSVLAAADAVEQAYWLLAERYTVYVVEYRQDVPQGYSVADAARDAADALRALGLTRACFFGASYGGMVAMEIAIAEPDLVQKLVLASTSARVGRGQFDVLDEWIRLAEAGGADVCVHMYDGYGHALYDVAPDFKERMLCLLQGRA